MLTTFAVVADVARPHDGKITPHRHRGRQRQARPDQPVLDHCHTLFPKQLEQTGVNPEHVDVILHTHVHSDHVG